MSEPESPLKHLAQNLAAPFAADEVHFRPLTITGNRALAAAYIDVRVVEERLDRLLGLAGWQDEYEVLPDNSVVCRLRLRLGEEWITKTDVGAPSEQPDEGDRRKAAFSDALKRAAIKFGIGRYLYRLPQQWCDWDPQKRCFVRPPILPDWALPQAPTKPRKKRLTADGVELARQIQVKERGLVAKRLCQPGEMVRTILALGEARNLPDDFARWPDKAMSWAVEQCRRFTKGVELRRLLATHKLSWETIAGPLGLGDEADILALEPQDAERVAKAIQERVHQPV